jgi:hypothetical protein
MAVPEVGLVLKILDGYVKAGLHTIIEFQLKDRHQWGLPLLGGKVYNSGFVDESYVSLIA